LGGGSKRGYRKHRNCQHCELIAKYTHGVAEPEPTEMRVSNKRLWLRHAQSLGGKLAPERLNRVRWQLAKASEVIILHGLDYAFFGVHHKRTVLEYRLANGLASD